MLVGSGVQTDATTPNNWGPAVHCGKDTTHESGNPCVMSVRGSNVVALRFGNHGTKECWELFAE